MVRLDNLCLDALAAVALFLGGEGLLSLQGTNRRLRDIAGSDGWWRRLFRQQFGALLEEGWVALWEADDRTDWMRLFWAAASASTHPPAVSSAQAGRATLLIGIGDFGVRAAALTAVALLPDGNLQPSGLPFPSPHIVQQYRAPCCGRGAGEVRIPAPPEFRQLQVGRCVPRTLFLGASEETSTPILNGLRLPSEAISQLSLFHPAMFPRDAPGVLLAARLLLGAEAPTTVVLLADCTAPLDEALAAVSPLICPPATAVAVAVIPSGAERSSALGLAALNRCCPKTILVESAAAAAIWDGRGTEDPPGFLTDTDGDGVTQYRSDLHRAWLERSPSLDVAAEAWRPRREELGTAVLAAGCLRTRAFDNLPDGLFCAGVSPVLPLPALCTQTAAVAHRARMGHIGLANTSRASVTATPAAQPPTLTALHGSYLGRLAWISATNCQLRWDLFPTLGLTESNAEYFQYANPLLHYVMSPYGVAYFQQVALLTSGDHVARLLERILEDALCEPEAVDSCIGLQHHLKLLRRLAREVRLWTENEEELED